MNQHPKVYLIAGVNGAGKTTFALEFLPKFVGQVNFINADLIAQGLSPLNPERMNIQAGRLLLQRIEELTGQGESFAFETTLSGRFYVQLLQRMKEKGYQIHVFYLWVPNLDLAIERIRARVREGGHSVPEPVVKRRYGKTLKNLFRSYLPLIDYLMIFDNSEKPYPVFEKKGSEEHILDAIIFDRILREVK